jgi:hypothetical protein
MGCAVTKPSTVKHSHARHSKKAMNLDGNPHAKAHVQDLLDPLVGRHMPDLSRRIDGDEGFHHLVDLKEIVCRQFL